MNAWKRLDLFAVLLYVHRTCLYNTFNERLCLLSLLSHIDPIALYNQVGNHPCLVCSGIFPSQGKSFTPTAHFNLNFGLNLPFRIWNDSLCLEIGGLLRKPVIFISISTGVLCLTHSWKKKTLYIVTHFFAVKSRSLPTCPPHPIFFWLSGRLQGSRGLILSWADEELIWLYTYLIEIFQPFQPITNGGQNDCNLTYYHIQRRNSVDNHKLAAT